MAVTWKGKGNLKKKALERLERDMDEAAQEAAQVFDNVVQASGREGKTRNMLNAPVTGRAYQTDKRIMASWGWSLGDRQANRDRMTSVGRRGGNDRESDAALSYFDLQNLGFRHRNGAWVEGMMANVESRERFRQVMRSKGY